MNKILVADSVICSVPNVLDSKHYIFLTDCSVCSKNYASSFGFTCNKCPDNTAGGIALAVILAFVVVFGFVALVSHLVSGRMGRADKGIVSRLARYVPLHSIKIVIVVWQIITQVSSSCRAKDCNHANGLKCQ